MKIDGKSIKMEKGKGRKNVKHGEIGWNAWVNTGYRYYVLTRECLNSYVTYCTFATISVFFLIRRVPITYVHDWRAIKRYHMGLNPNYAIKRRALIGNWKNRPKADLLAWFLVALKIFQHSLMYSKSVKNKIKITAVFLQCCL